MLEFVDVWKGGKKTDASKPGWLLKGASVTLPAGRKIAMLGGTREEYGAILQIMSGVAEPDKGAVRRTGVPCWPFDYTGFLEGKASLQQNAIFLGRVYGLESDEILRIAAKLSGVRIMTGKPYNHYSSLDRRALYIGLTLAIQFDWYFVNERLPHAPKDTADEVDAALADRMDRGTVIWATSNPQAVAGYCDAGLLLDRGSLTFYNSLEEAADAYRRSTESKAQPKDDRKPREANRRRRAARSAGEVDPEKSV